MIKRVVSGGQTGADRAGLDVAIALKIDHGGLCPRGRVAEDGRIPSRYALEETESPGYEIRTMRNVEISDATIIFTRGSLSGGSLLTKRIAEARQKPMLHLDLDGFEHESAVRAVVHFVRSSHVAVLNIAGNRESKSPGIYKEVKEVLMYAFHELKKETQDGSKDLRVHADEGGGTAPPRTGPPFRRK